VVLCYSYETDFYPVSRSAPTSPSHMGMSGTYTPDSLSREGSPIPEVSHVSGDSSVETSPAVVPTQPVAASLARIPAVVNDVRYSQSAPGSPSSE
jgi:forkhead box protein K